MIIIKKMTSVVLSIMIAVPFMPVYAFAEEMPEREEPGVEVLGIELNDEENSFEQDSGEEESLYEAQNNESSDEDISSEEKEGSEVTAGELEDEGISWAINNGVLTISGAGAMEDYDSASSTPWYSMRYSINRITIQDGVTSIGDYAFSKCSGPTNIAIPDSVTSIGKGAFMECINLKSVEIPDSVISIGGAAFADCTSLAAITIPDSVRSIEYSTFSRCTSLAAITIPDSVTSIGDGAFGTCTSLESITIPNGVTSIGSSAFNSCKRLSSITIPDSVTNIESSAFAGCSALERITIPDSVTSIGNGAFGSCAGLQSITIPNSVTSIGSSVFEWCTTLSRLSIPFIGDSSSNWSSLDSLFGGHLYNKVRTVILTGDIESIGNSAFYDCTNLTSITIPDSVKSIGPGAFSGCSNLTSITIPNAVTSIGSSAFNGCSSLTSITIPNAVTSIGASAFSGCSGLTSITISESVTVIEYNAFYGCDNAKFYVAGNSYAHRYVKSNNYKYDLFSGHTVAVLEPKEPSCEVQGRTEGSYCSTCGEVFVQSEIIPALDHEWNSAPTVDKEATCVEAGVKSIHCARCDSIKDRQTIPALGHNWDNTTTVEKEATCIEDGSESIHCLRCNAVKSGSVKVIPKTGHSFGAWVTVNAATEIAAGQQSHKCSVCGKSETKVIAQLTPTLPAVKIKKPKAAKKKITIKWKKVSKKNQKAIRGIEIQLATDAGFTNIIRSTFAGKKKTSKVIKGLQKGAVYYIRIRAYNGEHRSAWSVVKPVKAK